MRNKLKVFAMARPGALPLPVDRRITAFTGPDVMEEWGKSAAGGRVVTANATKAKIYIYETIGYDYWTDGGVTAEDIHDQLEVIGNQPVDIYVNSFGGDMFVGNAIYNLLREHPGEITVKIVGMAASAASVIAMAGDIVEIGANSSMMIHNCEVCVRGNQNNLRATADWMAPYDASMAEMYAARTGQSVEKIATMMNNMVGTQTGTFMSGREAIDLGFADKLLSSDQITFDKLAATAARELTEVRVMESCLMASAGRSRTQARAEINKIKGKQDATSVVTPDADAPTIADIFVSLNNILKK